MLKLEFLPEKTRTVFEYLVKEPLLNGFTLIGGTALALQVGHRRSEDLDFWMPSNAMNTQAISRLIRNLDEAQFTTSLLIPHHKIVTAKINGVDLLERVQDYAINGVKVTFFSRFDLPFQYFNSLERMAEPGTSFQIMRSDSIFDMKSFLIHKRVRSRDLFDLKTFLDNGRTIAEVLAASRKADPATSPEYAKSVLIGQVPLDEDDEGFESIGVTQTIDDIYAFFRTEIDKHEQQIAQQILEEIECEKCRCAHCQCDGDSVSCSPG